MDGKVASGYRGTLGSIAKVYHLSSPPYSPSFLLRLILRGSDFERTLSKSRLILREWQVDFERVAG